MTYWLVTFALIFFGFLAGFSIGPFLLPIGLAMLVLAPFRRRPLIYWPPMAAILGFNVGYLAVAPFICQATGAPDGSSATECSSIIGIHYTGTGIYNPSLLPGVYAGLAIAVITAVVVAASIWWSRKRSRLEARVS